MSMNKRSGFRCQKDIRHLKQNPFSFSMALVLSSCHFHSLRTCSSLPIRSFRPCSSMENIKPYVENDSVKETRALAAELCRHFYGLGWVSGTGGSITLKVNDPSVPLEDQLIVMAPSGVQKERMVPEDMYILGPDGSVLSSPSSKPAPHRPPKCSECAPLFLKAYTMRKAGAVIHSHGLEACLATMIVPGSSEFRITHMEMIKGIKGHGYHDELVLPIIENSAREYELTDTLADAIAAYPKATAVLVRNHGIYIWGDSWIQAKTQAECYHYLFEAAIRLHQMGLDPADPMHRDLKNRAVNPSAFAMKANGIITTDTSTSTRDDNAYPPVIVLDIEGTTTPISFVTDVLFPYARDHARSHLTSTYDTEETQNDIRVLREQISEDIKNGIVEAEPVPRDNESSKEAIIVALEANIAAMIKADRKVTALKQLQGHIWRSGYAKGELQGQVFEDVPQALSHWTAAGTKVYIYSSGSREAQRLIFGNTKYGDLRVYLSGYFDTKTGNKRESSSYSEIALSVGVDSPSEITFATDVLAEAIAAKQAGLNAVLLLRPGNVPLPSDHGFLTAKSLLDI